MVACKRLKSNPKTVVSYKSLLVAECLEKAQEKKQDRFYKIFNMDFTQIFWTESIWITRFLFILRFLWVQAQNIRWQIGKIYSNNKHLGKHILHHRDGANILWPKTGQPLLRLYTVIRSVSIKMMASKTQLTIFICV